MSIESQRSPYIEAHSKCGRPIRIHTDDAPNHHPSEVFRREVQRAPEFCNNCFSFRFEFDAQSFRCGELGWLDYERRYPVPGRNDPDPVRELRRGRPVFCAHCGHKSGKDRPLSHEQATAHAARISDALARRGIPHDRKTLLAVTVDKISEPDTTGVEDDHVFRVAVAEGVRAVQ